MIDSLAESDHCMITWMVDISRCPPKQREMFDYYKGDYEAIKQKLQGINWNDYLVGDTEQRWQAFKDLMVQLQRTHIPVKTFRKNAVKKAVWLDRKAVAAVRRKRRVYCKYKDNNHPAVKAQNKRARSELKRARWKFEKKMAVNIKSDTKSFFAYIRSLSSSSVKPTILHQQDGSKTSSPEETCNKFNEYFSSVFTSETMDNMVQPPTVFQGQEDDKLKTILITEEKVRKALGRMRVDKAPGADDMSPRVLVMIADYIVEPLCNIYSCSIADGVVPLDWRRANVCPVHKKGSRVLADNYRPISLTSQLCKVFEFIMREELVNHLEKLHLIYETQHGFRVGRSCLSNLLTFLEKVTKALDDGLCVDVIYLDLAKAFDKVPHTRLSHKLMSHGIEGEVLRWITNWLNGKRSDTTNMHQWFVITVE